MEPMLREPLDFVYLKTLLVLNQYQGWWSIGFRLASIITTFELDYFTNQTVLRIPIW